MKEKTRQNWGVDSVTGDVQYTEIITPNLMTWDVGYPNAFARSNSLVLEFAGVSAYVDKCTAQHALPLLEFSDLNSALKQGIDDAIIQLPTISSLSTEAQETLQRTIRKALLTRGRRTCCNKVPRPLFERLRQSVQSLNK